MIDTKIDYIVDRKTEILNKLLLRYDKNLLLTGKQDGTLGLYIDMLIYTLTLTSLGDNTRLELYKKLVEALRKNNLMFRIPEPPTDVLPYPYYYGSGAQGLTPVQIQALTADLSTRGDKSYLFNPTIEVYYIAYPAAYGHLTSIIDNNGFETLPGWTASLENFTESTLSISYYIYEFNNLTTQVDFTNTFKY